ncbi:MAG: N-acetyl sugar amidotransferase [bacterium]
MTEARDRAAMTNREGTTPSGQTCRRCLYDDSIPGTTFESDGICSYCVLHDVMDAQYPTGQAGESALQSVVDQMKAAGREKEFDCILGVSGGCDSSYLAHVMVERGLRPLAVHFDNTWASPTATNNIYTVLDSLKLPLETLVVDNREYDDIYRAFIESGVRDIEAATDIGFMSTLYQAAERHGVKYIVEGHSFRTEGVSPLGWLYMDGRYIKEVHRQHGTVPMNTFPNMPFARFVKWAAFSGIRRLRPLYWLDYDKEATKRFLTSEYGWEWYGGHHLENRFTAFYHTYFLPQRFGIDMRVNELSGRVRSGQLTREEAKAEYDLDPVVDPELLAMVKKRLGYTEERWEDLMSAPHRHYTDYPTYKRTFERFRFLFWLLYKFNRVPKTFYVKFCKKSPRH